MNGTPIAIPGLEYKLLWRVARATPRPLLRRLAAQFNKP